MRILLIILSSTILTLSCTKNKLEVELLKSEVIKTLPSASGIVHSPEGFYVIGDDSPYLFQLNMENQIIFKHQIFSKEHVENGRILKKHKPDFEGLEMINSNEIVAIGSGSFSPQRDQFLRIHLKDSIQVQTYNISKFYNQLRKSPHLQNEELNIEALAYKNGKIHLFNRGKNVIFSFDYSKLIAFFEGSGNFPNPVTTLFKLPKINGIESGFSGATMLKNKDLILFTSSVENTENAYNDGEILGSFICTIQISDEVISTNYQSALIPYKGKALKVESVAIIDESNPKEIKTSIVTDDDAGNSLKLECILKNYNE